MAETVHEPRDMDPNEQSFREWLNERPRDVRIETAPRHLPAGIVASESEPLPLPAGYDWWCTHVIAGVWTQESIIDKIEALGDPDQPTVIDAR